MSSRLLVIPHYHYTHINIIITISIYLIDYYLLQLVVYAYTMVNSEHSTQIISMSFELGQSKSQQTFIHNQSMITIIADTTSTQNITKTNLFNINLLY